MDNNQCLDSLVNNEETLQKFPPASLRTNTHRLVSYINSVISSETLHQVVSLLQLPRSLTLNFDLHLLYLRLAALLHNTQPHRVAQSAVIPLRAVNDEEENSESASEDSASDISSSELSSSDVDDVVGDSDLEYWWETSRVHHEQINIFQISFTFQYYILFASDHITQWILMLFIYAFLQNVI